jgi:hypothetical protein
MDRICKNCIYFERETSKYYPNLSYCKNDKLVDDNTFEDEFSDCPIDGIYATCDEQRGELQVGENFGCIHFEWNLIGHDKFDYNQMIPTKNLND